MSFNKPVWRATRERLQKILSKENTDLSNNAQLQSQLFVEQKDVKMHLPAQIG
jgi:fumarylacetoacetase